MTSATLRRVTRPLRVKRTHYYDPATYAAALAICERDELNISDVMRALLEGFVRKHERGKVDK